MHFSMSNRSLAARAERRMVEVLQRLGVAAHDLADGVIGGSVLALDELLDLADQLGILDEQGVGGEDGAVLLAELGADVLLDFAAPRGRRLPGPRAGA